MDNKLFISNPCIVGWDTLVPAGEGRFCSKCSTAVIDFTKMSSQEILTYLNKNKGRKICGRLIVQQPGNTAVINIPESTLFSQTKFINIFLLALIITMGSTLFSCKPKYDDSIMLGEIAYPEASAIPLDTIAPPPPPLEYDSYKSVFTDTLNVKKQ